MATFVALITETQKGETHIRDTVDRAGKFRQRAAEFGATVRELVWTIGEYDGVVIFDAPDDESAAALMFSLTAQGAVRTHTLRAFDADEMQAIIDRSDA